MPFYQWDARLMSLETIAKREAGPVGGWGLEELAIMPSVSFHDWPL